MPQLVQMAKDNPDILFLKVDWDENKPVAKALSVKVGATFFKQP